VDKKIVAWDPDGLEHWGDVNGHHLGLRAAVGLVYGQKQTHHRSHGDHLNMDSTL
jgi:hypothetical protein